MRTTLHQPAHVAALVEPAGLLDAGTLGQYWPGSRGLSRSSSAFRRSMWDWPRRGLDSLSMIKRAARHDVEDQVDQHGDEKQQDERIG